VKFIGQLAQKGKLLDYGCGTGEFLNAAKVNGWKVSGIEPNDKARKQANLKLDDKVKSSIDELKRDSNFDVVTLYHVLEHIHDLRKTLKKLINHLNTDGYIIIAVPNHESWDGQNYGKYWAGWDVPRHLYHFTLASMEKLEQEFDLQLKEVKPMKFDSFYVSLLSENYLNKKSFLLTRYWKAFLKGLRSNNTAKAPGQFSSNIFVFQKK